MNVFMYAYMYVYMNEYMYGCTLACIYELCVYNWKRRCLDMLGRT